MLNKMTDEMRKEVMAKIMEAIAEGKIKAVSIAFEGDEMDKEEEDEEDYHKMADGSKMEGKEHEEESGEMSKEEMKDALRSVENLKKYSKLMK